MGLTILSTYQYINTVEIKAYVATDIINTEHFSMFGLVTTHLQEYVLHNENSVCVLSHAIQ